MADRAEMAALNDRLTAFLADKPRLWEVTVESARTAREEGKSVFGPLRLSPRATTETLSTSVGDLPVRVFLPESRPLGVYLHLHGGGWVLGAPHHQDLRLEALADATRQAVVSLDYRLAPEHPYPSGPDDCEAAAAALVETAADRFGADALTIGGESAGAHLALVTLLRLRDRHGHIGFRAANLVYGAYDLRGTPSARLYGDRPQVLDWPAIRWFVDQFASEAELDDPDVSPLFADLDSMPPAILTIGTNDPLLDDSLFLHRRWLAAGLEADIHVFPDAPHAFDAFDVTATRRAHRRIHRFLRERLD